MGRREEVNIKFLGTELRLFSIFNLSKYKKYEVKFNGQIYIVCTIHFNFRHNMFLLQALIYLLCTKLQYKLFTGAISEVTAVAATVLFDTISPVHWSIIVGFGRTDKYNSLFVFGL